MLWKIPINSLATWLRFIFFKKQSGSEYFLKEHILAFSNVWELYDHLRQEALRFSKIIFVKVFSFCLYRYHLCRSAVKSGYINLDSRTNEEVKTHTKQICVVRNHSWLAYSAHIWIHKKLVYQELFIFLLSQSFWLIFISWSILQASSHHQTKIIIIHCIR